MLHLRNRGEGGREGTESLKETKEKSELCLLFGNILKYLSPRIPQQAAIPKVIYKKSSKESSAKGSFPEALWGLWLEGLDAADSWGKEDRERERKKDLRMTEHESRKCNERRSGFVLSSLINIKAAFEENVNIKI